MTYKNAPAEARELVALALESGKFKQGEGALCRDGKYCCLGVACEVFINTERPDFDHGEGISIHSSQDGRHSFGPEHDTSFLPFEVQEWLGFNGPEGHFELLYAEDLMGYDSEEMELDDDPASWDSLADVNDHGVSFKLIAPLFRNPPEGLLCDEG